MFKTILLSVFLCIGFVIFTFIFHLKGEELRKLIGAPVYIECSSKTQQVHKFDLHHNKSRGKLCSYPIIDSMLITVANTECESCI